MATIPEALAIASQHHQAGRLADAERVYRQVLAIDPTQPDALHGLGVIACQLGRFDVAIDLIGRAIGSNGSVAAFHSNLSKAFLDQGRLDDAVAACCRALDLDPTCAQAHYNLGTALKGLARLADAVACYRRAIELSPEFAEAHNDLGIVLKDLTKPDEAVVSYRRAIELRPGFAEAHNNLGNTLANQGKLDEAVACYRRAVELSPEFTEAHNNLGNALSDQGKLDKAIACYRRAIELRPVLTEAYNNLGNALRQQGKFTEAVAYYRRSLALGHDGPFAAQTHVNLGIALSDQGNFDEAVAGYRRALQLEPGLAAAYGNLANALVAQGQIDEAIRCYRRAIEIEPGDMRIHSALLFALTFFPHDDAKMIYEENCRWNQRFAEPLARPAHAHSNEKSPDRRLRIGYFSPDYVEGPTGVSILPLLEAHGHEQFEIFCYADVAKPDWITNRCQAASDVWRDVRGLSDEQFADLVREDRIDILVDLAMHLPKHRMLAFARKPAPVQVTWLGYVTTTGLTAIDYRLTDSHLNPPDSNDRCYSEESVRLPDSFWLYDPLDVEPEINRLPALEARHVTFGCLTGLIKINSGVVGLWSSVLRAVAGSKMTILAPEGSARERLLKLFQKEDIGADRVQFASRRPRHQYLELFRGIDIALDTLPYNSHSSALEGFWMGVPIVTLVGQTVVGRGGLSLLRTLGLPELIAETPEQYVEIAATLARDLPRLSTLRSTLRERLRSSPLMDAPRFARNIEAAYRQMWRRWCDRPVEQ